MEKLLTYLNSLSREARLAFVTACGTSEGYLRKAISARQQLGVALCVNLERESGGAVVCEELCPTGVDWAYIRSSRVRGPAPAGHGGRQPASPHSILDTVPDRAVIVPTVTKSHPPQ